jgi:hypothetical protein
MSNALGIYGHATWQLHNEDGTLAAEGEGKNLVTSVGDRMYAERGCGVVGPLAAPTGMKLGSGSTTPSKSGAGAALATYLADSHQAFDTVPVVTANGSGYRITYVAIFAAGKATTASPITEAVIVNEALTDATSSAAATIARILLTGVSNKAAGQTLTVTWTHDLLGA